MHERKCQKLKKSLLPILVLLAFSSCCTAPPVQVEKEFPRPAAPSIPALTWIDIPGYYGLDETSTDFDDLQEFLDKYDAYVILVNETFAKYEPDNPEEGE